MSIASNRRTFLKAAGAAVAFGAAQSLPATAAEVRSSTPNADKLGWRLCCAAYTFNQFPLFTAIETASLGVRSIEGFSWQPISAENKAQVNESLPAAVRKEIRKRLDDAGLRMVSCYLADLPGKEDAARKKFEFAKELGMEYFVAEPAPASMDLIEKLADEYEIALAIHNHPKPSSVYWDPAKVVEVTKGRSKRMGACCDTGHWVRSGLAPVECLKKLEGRIIGMHLKDITEFGVVNAPDVPWGTGKGQIAAILAEVRRQKAKPVFAIEYERHGDTMPDLRQSIAFYEKTAQE